MKLGIHSAVFVKDWGEGFNAFKNRIKSKYLYFTFNEKKYQILESELLNDYKKHLLIIS